MESGKMIVVATKGWREEMLTYFQPILNWYPKTTLSGSTL